MTASSYLNNDRIAATAQELLVRNKQLQQQVEQLTQERDAAIAETETFRETLVDNEAYGLQVIRERDAAKADAQRLASAAQAALRFIVNGVDVGRIQFPDPELNDPANLVEGKLRKALAAHQRGESGE